MSAVVKPLVILMLAIAAVSVHFVRSRLATVVTDADHVAECQRMLDGLPMSLGEEFRGQRKSHEEEIVLKAGADCHVAAVYADGDGFTYSIYVGGSMRPELAFHEPDSCLPAAGWRILEKDEVPFEGFDETGDEEIERLLVERGEGRMLVYHWFQAGDQVASTVWRSRFVGLSERLSTDVQGPRFIVIVYVPVRQSERETHQAARRFLKAWGPELLRAICGEDEQ